MTSRERVLAAIRHQEPDRAPIDLGAMGSTGIQAIGYSKLKVLLGIDEGQTRVYDTMQQLAVVEKPIFERFHLDVVSVSSGLGAESEAWKPWVLPDGSDAYVPVGFNPESDGAGGYVVKDSKGNVRMRAPEGCLYFEPAYHPLAQMTTASELEDWNPRTLSDEYLDGLRVNAKFLSENTDYAILGGFGGNILEAGQSLRGWGQFMMDMAADPEFTHAMLDKLTALHLANLKRYLEAVGDYIQIIQMGDDLGTQSATQLSLAMYREYIKPRHKAIYQYVREHSDVAVFLHSCGSVYDLIPDFIDEGVQILNPVQTSAAKMDPRRLKEEFGDKLTFWGGGCDTQTLLPTATPAEVREHVRERMEIFKPGGGFIFNQIHNVQADVPPENVVAMLDAAYEFGAYE
ncbi:MAG: uroporphyrinogen decarboxylase family protein [Candidatus Hydrogenedentes bacterium]|nr:uroporphyrinogen decarboxylase family protein [Candidatus Hydrogenedentota bacterium]